MNSEVSRLRTNLCEISYDIDIKQHELQLWLVTNNDHILVYGILMQQS